MTAHSEIDGAALQALGASLRARGAAPAPEPTRAPEDLAGGIARLRALVAGQAPALTEDQLSQLVARYKPENARRSLGRTGGYDRPQCPGCRAFLKHRGAQCTNCGFMDGAGYLSVPAKTSHLERWR